MTLAPAGARATSEGAAKFVYSVPISFTVQLENDYAPGNPSFSQGAGTILTSGSGTCTGTSGDTMGSYVLSFKTITPSSAGPTACLYQEGIGFSIDSNDPSGYTVYESLDVTSTPAYYGICVGVDHGGAPSPNAPNTAGTLSTVGTFNGSNQLTACGTGGTLLPPAPGAVTNAGAGGPAALLTAPPTGAYVASGVGSLTALWTYGSIYTGGTVTDTGFFGEDVQLNVSANAPSGAGQFHAIILYFVSS
jgi:hypothetical protein